MQSRTEWGIKWHMLTTHTGTRVDFTNVLQAAFKCADHQKRKTIVMTWLSFLGSAQAKAVRKMLVKFVPDCMSNQFFLYWKDTDQTYTKFVFSPMTLKTTQLYGVMLDLAFPPTGNKTFKNYDFFVLDNLRLLWDFNLVGSINGQPR